MADDNLEERIRDTIIGEIESPIVVVADYDTPWPWIPTREPPGPCRTVS